MTESETPRAAHAEFNALCDGLDEYEPLPTTTAGRKLAATGGPGAGAARQEGAGAGGAEASGVATDSALDGRSSAPATAAHLDAEILAGLVNP